MEKCKRMKRQLCMSKNWVYSWLWKSSKTHQQYYRSESFAMKTGILMNGSTVKNHTSIKRYSDTVQHGELRSDRGSRLVEFVLRFWSVSFKDTFKTGESFFYSSSSSSPMATSSDNETQEREDRIESDISPVTVSTKVDDRSGQPVVDQANQNPKPNKKEPKIERDDPLCSDIRERLQEFRENLVDDEILEHGDSHASSSHEASLEPIFRRREDLGKHSVKNHIPKNRNCEICRRTKITRAPCRRRNGGAVPRAENFGDLI